MTRRPKLKIRKPARKRQACVERTRPTSRAAQTLLAAANGAEQHWSHDDIRTALLRRHAVELDDLLEELPRPAINHAVTKGWIHRTAGEPCFRVTTRAASELKLPAPPASDSRTHASPAAKAHAVLEEATRCVHSPQHAVRGGGTLSPKTSINSER